MTSQVENANLFASLHVKGEPLVLFNIWDAGSAVALRDVDSTKAVATSSWAVAAAHGFEDGEELPFDLALANLERIVAAVDVPVSFDLEGGYGQRPAKVKASVLQAIRAGAVGINFEDQIVGGDGLYSLEQQCARIEACRRAAEQASVPIFINARTDIFLKVDHALHNDDHLIEAISRSSAYARSGASGFFAPGLVDDTYIEKLCELSPIPVNIMIGPETPSPERLAELGVARISYGANPYLHAINYLKALGSGAFSISWEIVRRR